MLPSADMPPIRLMTRLLAEMQTNIVSDGLRLFQGNLDRFVIYTLIVRQTGQDPVSPEEPPHRPGTAISASSLAASLSRPFETVRRHVNALVEMELCARVPKGVVALPQALTAVSATTVIAHDSFVRLVEDLAKFDVPMPQPRPSVPYHPATGLRAAADMMLTVVDSNADAHHEWINLVLFSAIFCANSRGYTHDPVLARTHADHNNPAPDSLKVPVRVQAIARAMHLPYSTAQRRIQQLIAAGSVRRVSGGMLANEAWLNSAPAVAVSTNTYHNVLRVLGTAAAVGFPFDDPKSAYLHARPAPVPF